VVEGGGSGGGRAALLDSPRGGTSPCRDPASSITHTINQFAFGSSNALPCICFVYSYVWLFLPNNWWTVTCEQINILRDITYACDCLEVDLTEIFLLCPKLFPEFCVHTSVLIRRLALYTPELIARL